MGYTCIKDVDGIDRSMLHQRAVAANNAMQNLTDKVLRAAGMGYNHTKGETTVNYYKTALHNSHIVG